VSAVSDVYKLIGERIREAREDRGWTQAQLGEAIGYTQATIGNYELGRRHVSVDDLYKIGEALGKPYAYFIGADKQYEEQVKREAEQRMRNDVAGYVGVRMLPILRNPVANGVRLGPTDLLGSVPVPREFGPRADVLFQVATSCRESNLRKGDYVFIRRENSGQRGQIVLGNVDGCVGLVTCSAEDGFIWTDTGQPIMSPVTVVGEFCGLFTGGTSAGLEVAPPAEPSGWSELTQDERRQVQQFVEFLRARRLADEPT